MEKFPEFSKFPPSAFPAGQLWDETNPWDPGIPWKTPTRISNLWFNPLKSEFLQHSGEKKWKNLIKRGGKTDLKVKNEEENSEMAPKFPKISWNVLFPF